MIEPIISLDSLSFSYAAVSDDQETLETTVFDGLSLSVPSGVTSLVGQNGVGKSTFLLLAGARIFPSAGTVSVLGTDTRAFVRAGVDPEVEAERNRLVSFIYQNMEFETDEPIGDLMEYVYAEGYYERKDPQFLARIQRELDLGKLLSRATGTLSKGELQRTIIGFSLLYGSRIVLMDEPVFALEEDRKERVFAFLMEVAAEMGVSICYSAHNLELTSKYSDTLMLFFKDGSVRVGPTGELFQRTIIEEAYQVPYDMLYRKEYLYREMLNAMPRPGTE